MTLKADARMQRARELLAASFKARGFSVAARGCENGSVDTMLLAMLDAIAAALSEQTDAREAALREAADYAGRRNRGFIAAGGRSDQAFGRALEAEHMRDAILALIGKAPGA